MHVSDTLPCSRRSATSEGTAPSISAGKYRPLPGTVGELSGRLPTSVVRRTPPSARWRVAPDWVEYVLPSERDLDRRMAGGRALPCDVSKERLWSWIDRGVPELETHLAQCPQCRALAKEYRTGIKAVAVGCASEAVPLPERIGSYSITGLLGEGGQALVYKAEQQTPRRPVALKVLKGGRCVGQQDVRHFQREIQTLAALSHPGIATIYEGGRTAEGHYFFAMELIDGVPLDVYVHEHKLPVRERLELFCKVCAGVQYAHEQGVIHRDLKPSNILLTASGEPKILDFGLARLTNAEATLTQLATLTGQIMGTLRYMSPAQARGNPSEIDERTDVYSLGVILYELLTGRSPYELSNVVPDAVRTICEVPPRRPSSTLGPDGRPARHLRGDLETIVLKALEKEPSRRYASARALADDIRRHLTGEPILARPPSGLYVLRRKLARHRGVLGLAAVALALGLLGTVGGIGWSRRADAEARRVAQRHQRSEGLWRARDTLLDLLRQSWQAPNGSLSILAGDLMHDLPELREAPLVFSQIMFRVPPADRRQSAFTCLESRRQRDPSCWECAALLSEMYRETGKSTRAAELEAQVEREAPDTAEAWYLRSLATLDKATARQYAEEATRCEPGHVFAWHHWTNICTALGDLEAALRGADKMIALSGSPRDWQQRKADLLRWTGRPQEAVDLYGVLISTGDVTSSVYEGRAAAYLRLKMYPEAVADYVWAEKARPPEGPYMWVRYRRATPLWIMGRTVEALEHFRYARDALGRPSYADARAYLILRDEGRDLEARQVLDSALGEREVDFWLVKVLVCLAGRLTPEELIADAQNGDDREHQCEAYYYAGEMHRLAGRLDQARVCFTQCVSTGLADEPDTGNAMSEYHLAVWRLDHLNDSDNSSTDR